MTLSFLVPAASFIIILKHALNGWVFVPLISSDVYYMNLWMQQPKHQGSDLEEVRHSVYDYRNFEILSFLNSKDGSKID